MRKATWAALALGAALAASPLLAQQDNPAGSSPSSQPAQAEQSNAATASPSQDANAEHATGSIVSISDTRLELKVEASTGPSPTASAAMVGKTFAFTLNSTTDMPVGLRPGDRVSVWFGRENGSRLATRVALADASTTSSNGSGEQSSNAADQSNISNSSASPENGTTGTTSVGQTSSQPSTSNGETSTTATGSMSQAEQGGTAVNGTNQLPKTASPLPLIGLIGFLALAGAVVLRFALKAA